MFLSLKRVASSLDTRRELFLLGEKTHFNARFETAEPCFKKPPQTEHLELVPAQPRRERDPPRPRATPASGSSLPAASYAGVNTEPRAGGTAEAGGRRPLPRDAPTVGAAV